MLLVSHAFRARDAFLLLSAEWQLIDLLQICDAKLAAASLRKPCRSKMRPALHLCWLLQNLMRRQYFCRDYSCKPGSALSDLLTRLIS